MYYEEQCNELWELLGEDCKAIYLSGAHVDQYIDMPRDYDLIVFCEADRFDTVKAKCHEWKDDKRNHDIKAVDVVVCCDAKIRVFSYLNNLMIRLKGTPIEVPTDFVSANRQAYIDVMYDCAKSMYEADDKRNKNWYHIFRGCKLIVNESYNLTDEEKHDLNWLHNQYEDGRDERVVMVYSMIKQLKGVE